MILPSAHTCLLIGHRGFDAVHKRNKHVPSIKSIISQLSGQIYLSCTQLVLFIVYSHNIFEEPSVQKPEKNGWAVLVLTYLLPILPKINIPFEQMPVYVFGISE
jgi:hypothetical protein